MGKKEKARRAAMAPVPSLPPSPATTDAPPPPAAVAPAPAAAPAPAPANEGPFTIGRLLRGISGSELCYGEAVEVGGRKVIPVARVRAAGGGGFGDGGGGTGGDTGTGGGGGGWIDSTPVGFIDVAGDQARFVEIADPDRTARLVRAAAGALTTLLGAAAGARALRGRRGPAGLLGPGRRS